MKHKLDNISLENIYSFMETGSVASAPEEIVEYLQILDKTHGMIQRIREYGTREAVIKHLELVDGLSRYKASLIYAEAIEYFYHDTNISKQAWRNIYASRLDDSISAAKLMAKSVEDLDRISRMEERAFKMRQLDKIDPPVIPKEAFAPRIKVYSFDMDTLGLPRINRQVLARQIDEIEDLSASQKEILKQDALITPFTLFPNEQEDSRKQE